MGALQPSLKSPRTSETSPHPSLTRSQTLRLWQDAAMLFPKPTALLSQGPREEQHYREEPGIFPTHIHYLPHCPAS